MKTDRSPANSIRLIAAIVVALASLGLCYAASAAVPRGFEIVAENDHLVMYMNMETAEVAVLDKQSEQIWYTNPPDRNSVEKIARGDAKLAQGAQFRLTYFEPGDIMRTVDSYISSVALNQFDVSRIENGVRVDYLVGRQWNERDYLPLFLDKRTFEEDVLGKITDKGTRRTVESNYILLTLEPATAGSAQIAGYSIKALNENLRDRDQRTLTEVVIDHLVANKSSLRDRNDIKASTLESLIGVEFYMLRQRERDLLAWDLADIVAAMKDIELDPAVISDYYENIGLDRRIPNIVLFNVSMEYTIDGTDLVVRVPAAEIQYPNGIINQEGQRVTYPLVAIDILPYFGAASVNEEGYMLVPDGSGGLIHLNNGKTNLPSYASRIYGRDNALSAPPSSIESRQSCFPVFGLKSADKAFLAVIEEGDALTQVMADISGKRESYNTIYAQVRLMGHATTSLQGEVDATYGESAQWVIGRTSINVYQSDIYRGEIRLRYQFLHGQDAGYQGMARRYQEYLASRQQITRLRASDSLPMFIELVGAVYDYRPILGVSREQMLPLTTYTQAKDIVSAIAERGISNLYVVYNGWMRHGIDHSYPTRVRLEGVLGSRSDLASLRESVESIGGRFYPSVDFVLVRESGFLSGFWASRDASRFLNRTAAQFSISSGQRASIADRNTCPVYVLSPSRLDGLVSSYLADYVKYGFRSMTLGDLAFQLHSDFRHGRSIDRQAALAIVKAQMAKAKDAYSLDLLANGLNAYALPYVTSAINLPMVNGGQDIVDESVPFVQMVLHGYVHYAGDPVNYSPDREYLLLKSVETGSLPYYLGYHADPSILKGTWYDYLYTGRFTDWVDDAASFYATVQPVLSQIHGERMVDHRRVSDGVYETVYENGISVVVNYGTSVATVAGHEIGPRDFVMFERSQEAAKSAAVSDTAALEEEQGI